jgi:hypothetical protein
MTALHHACEKGHADVALTLMEKAPSLITMVDNVSDRAIFDHSVCAGLVLVSHTVLY